MADGTEVERDISECHINLPQGEGHTPVILGQDGDEALLGIVTLEILERFRRDAGLTSTCEQCALSDQQCTEKKRDSFRGFVPVGHSGDSLRMKIKQYLEPRIPRMGTDCAG